MKSKTTKAAGKASLDPLVGPCPFCGATATTVRSPSGGPMQRLQHTADCYFGGAHLFVENDDRIEPWNRRANAPRDLRGDSRVTVHADVGQGMTP